MENVTCTLPVFGAFIPGQGGHFAAVMRGPDNAPYALLVSARELEVERATWGGYGRSVDGAGSRTDGRANTQAMLAADCPAATAVSQVQAEGHTDYFLPALGQLNAAAANVPELFDPNGVYWTSTQASRNGAFAQDFELGGSGWTSKDAEFRVRAFRQIPLELLTA